MQSTTIPCPECLEAGDEIMFDGERGETIIGLVTKRCEDLDGYIHVRTEWGYHSRLAGWQGRLVWYRPKDALHGFEVDFTGLEPNHSQVTDQAWTSFGLPSVDADNEAEAALWSAAWKIAIEQHLGGHG